MRAYELFEAANSFFLGSDHPLDGLVTVADLRTIPNASHVRVEAILEDARPADCLARDLCLILAERREDVPLLGMPTTRIYRVEPVGAVQRSDHGWWAMISDGLTAPPLERPPLEEWAREYWSGAECMASPYRAWEARVDTAKIVGLANRL